MTVKHPLMVVGTADRNLIVYNLQNPQVTPCLSLIDHIFHYLYLLSLMELTCDIKAILTCVCVCVCAYVRARIQYFHFGHSICYH
jgi:hypothetical protein